MDIGTFKDFLKVLFPEAGFYYCGKLDNKKQKSVGVYTRNTARPLTVPVGGTRNKTYFEKSLSILVHWNKSSTETEKSSALLLERLVNCNNESINDGEFTIKYIRSDANEAVDVGTDENGIYERTIWITVIYE